MAQRSLFVSRAQAIGIKPKVLASRTKRSLKTMRGQMENLATPWVDIDNSLSGALDDLLRAFDDFSKAVDESVSWLEEIAPD